MQAVRLTDWEQPARLVEVPAGVPAAYERLADGGGRGRFVAVPAHEGAL